MRAHRLPALEVLQVSSLTLTLLRGEPFKCSSDPPWPDPAHDTLVAPTPDPADDTLVTQSDKYSISYI